MSLPTSNVFSRIPYVAIWIWAHTLFVDIQNQTQPGAVEQDKLNKPWRPLPAKRLTKAYAESLLSIMYLLIPLLAGLMDTMPQSMALIVMGFMYNDMGGADRSIVARNLLNGIAISDLLLGATGIILSRSGSSLSPTGYRWFFLLAVVISTTVQVQDLADQHGDRLTKRRTLPLVLGDGLTRWTIVAPVALWSFLCPLFLKMKTIGYLLPLILGSAVCMRTLRFRSVNADEGTYRIWNLWMGALFLLPFIKCLSDGCKLIS